MNQEDEKYKAEVIHQLINLARQGFDISDIADPNLTLQINQIVQFEDINKADLMISQLIKDWKVDEKENAIKQEFQKMDIDDELDRLKQDLGL